MILADSSIWIDHFRHHSTALGALLIAEQVLIHPFVIGELALGSLKRRKEALFLLGELPHITQVQHVEVMGFIEHHDLHSQGIGYVDAHLLAAARLSGVRLWTRDKRLHAAASQLHLAASPLQ